MMCACIMIFLSIEVIQFSMVDIAKGIDGQILPLKLDLLLYTMIVIGIITKLALFMLCRWIYKFGSKKRYIISLSGSSFQRYNI
jgi:hypothetical protein